MYPSEPPSSAPNAGFTLFEALIVLAILAAITGIAATALRPPSQALQLARQAADLTNETALARARAIRDGVPVRLALPQCHADARPVSFFPDGTATQGTACLSVEGFTRRLQIDPVTARLLSEDG